MMSTLALSILGGAIAGCNPRENEAEDVREAQGKLDEEKRDLAAED